MKAVEQDKLNDCFFQKKDWRQCQQQVSCDAPVLLGGIPRCRVSFSLAILSFSLFFFLLASSILFFSMR